MNLKKIKSLSELKQLAKTDKRYEKLVLIAAKNLGGNPKDIDSAHNWLMINAIETDERGVVSEVNFCRDLV